MYVLLSSFRSEAKTSQLICHLWSFNTYAEAAYYHLLLHLIFIGTLQCARHWVRCWGQKENMILD